MRTRTYRVTGGQTQTKSEHGEKNALKKYYILLMNANMYIITVVCALSERWSERNLIIRRILLARTSIEWARETHKT